MEKYSSDTENGIFFPILFVTVNDIYPVWQKMSVTQSSARHQRQSPVTRILCGQT